MSVDRHVIEDIARELSPDGLREFAFRTLSEGLSYIRLSTNFWGATEGRPAAADTAMYVGELVDKLRLVCQWLGDADPTASSRIPSHLDRAWAVMRELKRLEHRADPASDLASRVKSPMRTLSGPEASAL